MTAVLWLLLISAILLFLFLPIPLKGYVYFDSRYKKLIYSIKVFSKLKVNGGYITFTTSEAIVHRDKNKKIVLYKDILRSNKKNVKNPLKIKEIESIIEYEKDSESSVYLLILYKIFYSIFYSVINSRSTAPTINNRLIFREGIKACLQGRINAEFNVFQLLKYFVQNKWEEHKQNGRNEIRN